MDTKIEQLGLSILQARALEIREVPEEMNNDQVPRLPINQQPFLYSTGNWGPGYLMIKGLGGKKKVIRTSLAYLALKIAKLAPYIDFVVGNVTGGMIPGWELSERLEDHFGREIPFVYARGTRKAGGQREQLTGIEHIPKGANALVVEELVNFAGTTCNSALLLRDAGYVVTNAACIVYYDNPHALQDLIRYELAMTYLLTVPEILDIAEKHQTHPKNLIDEYRGFLVDPLAWQSERGLTRVEEGGTL